MRQSSIRNIEGNDQFFGRRVETRQPSAQGETINARRLLRLPQGEREKPQAALVVGGVGLISTVFLAVILAA